MTSIALHSDLNLEMLGLPEGWLNEVLNSLILAGVVMSNQKSCRKESIDSYQSEWVIAL